LKIGAHLPKIAYYRIRTLMRLFYIGAPCRHSDDEIAEHSKFRKVVRQQI